MFYVSLVANKNIKSFKRFTKDKEKEIKEHRYSKLSVHNSNGCAKQLSCPGLYNILQDQVKRICLS